MMARFYDSSMDHGRDGYDVSSVVGDALYDVDSVNARIAGFA